jgi:hypothetical protein
MGWGAVLYTVEGTINTRALNWEPVNYVYEQRSLLLGRMVGNKATEICNGQNALFLVGPVIELSLYCN